MTETMSDVIFDLLYERQMWYKLAQLIPCITTHTCGTTRSTDRQPKQSHAAAIKFSQESFIDKLAFHSKAPSDLGPRAKITHATRHDKGEGKPSECVPS